MNLNKKVACKAAKEKIDKAEPLYGTCNGRFSFTPIKSSMASSLLPSDLELAPQSYTPEGLHPVLFMFNDTKLHTNVFLEKIAKDNHLELNLHYNEFIVMLPYVQFKEEKYNEDGPFCFLPVLYLDSLLAVLGGRIFWEFNKELAHFTTDKPIYKISHELFGPTYFTSEFSDTDTRILGSSLENFVAITPILRLPVLEHGIIGYMKSIYKVEYENAFISPFSLKLTNESCKFLPKGNLQSPKITNSVMGCFKMTYNWSLTYPKLIILN